MTRRIFSMKLKCYSQLVFAFQFVMLANEASIIAAFHDRLISGMTVNSDLYQYNLNFTNHDQR